ncbi:MAG: thioredoxin, partial [Myxococcota bacterium]
MTVVSVRDSTFETDVLRSELPVLIDLYADWCGPCKQLAPIVEEVARDLEGKLKVCKVDVERSPMIAQSFGVQSIPMLVVFKDGRPVGQHMGLLDKPGLLALVEPVLPASADELKPKDLAELLRTGRVRVVDLRDAGTFARYRIPTATNVPHSEIETRLGELQEKDGRLLVLYGRTSDEAR